MVWELEVLSKFPNGLGHADAGHADAGHADAGHADAGHADAGHADSGHADAEGDTLHVTLIVIDIQLIVDKF